MTTLVRWKLACGVVGIVLFLYGTRTNAALLRWAGIGALGIAVLLRFVRPRPDRD